jgi:pectinesterase
MAFTLIESMINLPRSASLACAALVLSVGPARAADPPQKVVVSKDGRGSFATIQGALDSMSIPEPTPVLIVIRNGTYREKLFLRRSHLALVGEDRDSTRIEFAELREHWNAEHNGSDWGAGVVNIDTGTADITLANLTVHNTYGGEHKAWNSHQFAIKGAGTRIMLLHCAVISDGGDALSLWNTSDGMYYHNDCFFEGWVDYVCPRGWCYITASEFFGHNRPSASLWHDGSGGRSQKFVITNSEFDGVPGFPLGRNHRDGQFFLIHCTFSKHMADRPFYRPPSSPAPWKWGDRHYYFGCHRQGGDYPWFADNLQTAEGAPTADQITARWTFDGRWDPEANPPSVLPYASFPDPKPDATVTARRDLSLRWTAGFDATAHIVYIGTTNPPAIHSTQTACTYPVTGLRAGVTYFWRVDEVTQRDTVRGRVWSFTLR